MRRPESSESVCARVCMRLLQFADEAQVCVYPYFKLNLWLVVGGFEPPVNGNALRKTTKPPIRLQTTNWREAEVLMAPTCGSSSKKKTEAMNDVFVDYVCF